MTPLLRAPWLPRLLLVFGASIAAGCSDSSGPKIDPPGTEKPPAQLAIIKLPASAPPLFNDSAAFYARVNRDAEGIIYFQDSRGGRGEKFARLRIKQRSLLARPDGSPFGPNDSIRIVMRVTNPKELAVEFSPTGLKFSSQDPAELEFEYEETGGDLNGDGKEDEKDDEIEQVLAIWRQEKAGDPYVKLGTIKTEGARELKAELVSFSRYIISY